MQVRRVSRADLRSINNWLSKQKHEQASESMLPAVGFIVPGVAAGFIRDCETSIGMLDSFVSNPTCTGATRHRALEAITAACLSQPFSAFITMTSDLGLQRRFQEHGFAAAPQYLWLIKGGS